MRPPQLLILLIICLWIPGLVHAQTPIHKCKSADGGVTYSQLPCKDEVPTKVEESEEPEATEEAPPTMSLTEMPALDNAEEDAATSEDRAACKKRFRDEIDAIDAEIRREYSPEKDSEYKKRLLALTRELRAC